MTVSTKQRQIATIAQRHREVALTSLNKYLDKSWMLEAFGRVRKKSAPGVDGERVVDYESNLLPNLEDLLGRAKSGRYHAPPVKRVYIPKGKGDETRPIGLPTTEDKILQRAVAMLLEPIYEEEFYDFSFGFRPKRNAHQALRHIQNNIYEKKTRWILDLDIRKFFDTLSHEHLRKILRQRVNDGVITRLIDKWMKAGVMEEANLSYPDQGTPQGGVISPLLANLYLHEVLDHWFVSEVQPRLKGRSFLVRYADDAVMGFENEADAQRVLKVLAKRMEKYSLQLHPEKTRLIYFERPPRYGQAERVPESFDFLGFTHYWRRSRKGNNVVAHKTAKDRLTRSLGQVRQWCKKNRHRKLSEQHEELCRKVQGHYAYYGVSSNIRCLGNFLWETHRIWRKWLDRRSRRSKRAKGMTWERFNRLTTGPLALPRPRIFHRLYPEIDAQRSLPL
jgi:RNA-directed DNA polymerase